MRRPFAAITALALMAGLSVSPSARADAPAAVNPPPLFKLGPKTPAPSLVFVYDGFSVDASRTAKGAPPERTIGLIKGQIDLVQGVGLKPEVLAFMRQAPILADPAKPDLPGESVRYEPGKGVMIRVSRLAPKKAVLLEGLLEAYADQRPAPAERAEVSRFRSEAAHLSPPRWPRTAAMLKSDSAYFAMTASAYLYGEITREPYTRKDLRQTQPRYFHWLAEYFDDGKARGSPGRGTPRPGAE